MVTNNPRMSVSHNGHNSWTLGIDIVQRNDSGLYMCQINTEPMTSQVRLKLLTGIHDTIAVQVLEKIGAGIFCCLSNSKLGNILSIVTV